MISSNSTSLRPPDAGGGYPGAPPKNAGLTWACGGNTPILGGGPASKCGGGAAKLVGGTPGGNLTTGIPGGGMAGGGPLIMSVLGGGWEIRGGRPEEKPPGPLGRK